MTPKVRSHSPRAGTPPFYVYILGFLRLIRVQNLLIIVGTQYFARVTLIGPRDNWTGLLLDPKLFLLSVSTVLIAAAGYIINDYFDIKIDLINKPDRVIIGRYLKRQIAMGLHQGLNFLGVVIGFYLSKWVFVVNVLSVTLLWFYSSTFKRQPFIGNFIVALLTALSLIVLAVFYRQQVDLLLIYALFSFVITLVREIIKDMEDVKGDARFGCRTLPIVWGLRRTKQLLYVIIATFILSLFTIAHSLQNEQLFWMFVILLVPIAWLVYRLVRADTKRDFAYLSSLCKLIMLIGVVSMAWV
ncbi:geranylgeranylglycerol-phosphate geranylgeranyltransferase [Larkinella humicola]|uniref:Prenyltransferase n=1 Tax=Larkinella humicola TaxID=2607654 RepID=A0A5N1JIG2_9BACT|nr:geranylgeranylglycerol-phosphate geranylgeranyltransferase [Larkinella humicola]KAA9355165.1 prenyltransferase [Larkinella humicola]